MTDVEKLAWQVLEVLHSGEVERLAELVSEDFVDHSAPPGVPPGRAGYAGTLRWVHDTLAVRYEVHDVIAVADRVAIRATAHGVHQTDHLGVPPTGRPYAMPTMHWYRGAGGLLVEHWGVRDELGLLLQVGALPGSPAVPQDAPA